MMAQPDAPQPLPDLDGFVQSLKSVFGDRALDVARRQAELADGTSGPAWAAIVARLGG